MKNPIVVTLFFLLLGVLGIVAIVRMGRSTLPPVTLPVVTVSASYPQAGPQEVERLLIEPMEDALSDVPDVSRVSASAQNGLAEIVVSFRFGSALEVDRANVQQAVDAARATMPADVIPPVVSESDPAQAPILEEGVSSVLISSAELSDILARQIAPALRATAGVGEVRVTGADARQFTIRPRRGALYALHGTPLDVFRAAAAGNDVLPGGILRSPVSQATIGIDAAATSKRALENLPVAIPGDPLVRLGDVAAVSDSAADATTVSRVDGAVSAIVYVSHAPGQDSIRTIAAVRQSLRRLAALFPAIRFEELRTDAPSTKAAINGVLQTLGEGVVLTVLVMLFFLHAWRNAAIAAISIPTSLCAAFFAMWIFGFTLNVLSLMGLSLTIGILVDDSIVIIEAISRNARLGRPGDEAALAGRRELGGAAFAITLVDVAVFIPIALMPGLVGEFMREFGLVIVFATAFSLLVAFTLTPILAARWAIPHRGQSLDNLDFAALLKTLRGRARTFPWTFRTSPLLHGLAAFHGALNGFDRVVRRIGSRYAGVWLPAALKRRRLVAAGAFALSAVALAPLFAGKIPTEFSPPLSRGEVTVDVNLPPGTPLGTTDADAVKITNALLNDPAVAHVEATSGRAFNGNSDIFASNVAQLGIVLTDTAGNGGAVAAEAKALNRLVPDAAIAGAGKGMGGAAPVSFSVGGDPKVLDRAAARIVAALRKNPFATDVRTSDVGVAPHVQIGIDDDRARLLDVSPDDAAQTARIATAGAIAAKARLPSGLVNVVVQSGAAERGSLQDVARQTVRSSNGTLVPLGDLSRVTQSEEPVVIDRENGRRVVTVSANPIDGAPISLVTSDISQRLRDPNFLPPGARIEPRGDIEQFLDTALRMVAALAISLVFVYVILAVLYASYTLPLVIMLTVPMASVGAFGTLFVLNAAKNVWPSVPVLQFQTLNLYSMLGIIMLVGLAAKNGILLVEYAERAIRDGRSASEAAVHAAQMRFRPILMTTLAMIAGMLPLALGDTIGAEYRRALGTVVIGGLTTSLFLTLFVVPVAYVAYRERAAGRARRGAALPVRGSVAANA